MTIRIGCTGVHSGGKTSSAGEIFARLKGKKYTVNLIPEQARDADAHGFALDLRANADSQVWILASQMREEMELLRTPAQFMVCDRVVYDAIPYTRANPNIDFDHRALIEDIALLYGGVYPYDLLIYHPPFKKIEDDGVRATDPSYQKHIEGLFKEVLDNIRPKGVTQIVEVHSMDKEERQTEAANLVFEFLRNKGWVI